MDGTQFQSYANTQLLRTRSHTYIHTYSTTYELYAYVLALYVVCVLGFGLVPHEYTSDCRARVPVEPVSAQVELFFLFGHAHTCDHSIHLDIEHHSWCCCCRSTAAAVSLPLFPSGEARSIARWLGATAVAGNSTSFGVVFGLVDVAAAARGGRPVS